MQNILRGIIAIALISVLGYGVLSVNGGGILGSAGRQINTGGSLVSTDIDTSSELATILTDETGSGLAVFGTSPTIATPTFTGLSLFNSASTTLFSSLGPAYFGSTATSSFNTAGALTLVSALGVSSGGTGWANINSGYIPFGNGASAISTSTNLFWDNTNSRLGVGTTSPFVKLSLGSGAITTTAQILATSTSMTIDWRDGNQQTVRIGTAAVTIAHTGYIPGQTLVLETCNPGGTASTITYTGVLWPGGTAPTHTTTANKCDLDIFRAGNGTSTPIIYGGFNQNY